MGIYLRLANEIYLAISLLPLFLSGQLNAQLSWASREVPVAISHSPMFWIFQQQQDGRGMKPSCAPTIAPTWMTGFVLFSIVLFQILTSLTIECSQTLRGKKKPPYFPLTKSGNHSVIIQQEDMSFLAFPRFFIPLDMGIRSD